MSSAAAHDDELVRVLHQRGQRVTSQRIVVHRALRELDRHVTAEEVHSAVAERLPGLSLPTIYSTLDLFEELGIVRRIGREQGAILFEPRMRDHHHAACRSCGRIDDVEADLDAAPALRAARRRGFRPERAELVVTGLCAACARVASTDTGR